MIRPFNLEDLDDVMTIWFEENIKAHSFISADSFKLNRDMVRMILPMSEVYVQDINGVKGFIGLTGDFISGLFIADGHQHKGLGSSLITKAKDLHSHLSVAVYTKNDGAYQFYQRQGFDVVETRLNEETGESEYLMECMLGRSIKIGKCAL